MSDTSQWQVDWRFGEIPCKSIFETASKLRFPSGAPNAAQ